ncbi:MAG TPA: hypothetical protein VIN03_02925 [Roseateles sp.]
MNISRRMAVQAALAPVSTPASVSGLHHNVFGGFVSLRPALFSAANGEARFRNFIYQGLPA